MTIARQWLIACLILTAGSTATPQAGAAPVVWFLDGVELDDGAAAAGSFVFDADTGQFSNVQITTQTGPVVAGSGYGDPLAAGAGALRLAVVPDGSAPDLSGQARLDLSFVEALTDAGGTRDIEAGAASAESQCTNAGCEAAGILRTIVAGRVIAPEGYVDDVVWHLAGVTFDDGGVARGSFRHDPSPQAYSQIRIATSEGNSFAGAAYGDPIPEFDFGDLLVAVPDAGAEDLSGEPTIALRWSRVLRRAGGAVTVLGSSSDESRCDDADCLGFTVRRRPQAGRALAPLLEVRRCSSPGIAIPDNAPSGITDSLALAFGGAILDLDVSLRVTHTYVGDLAVTLTGGATGTAVTLLSRPGQVGGDFGCPADDIDAALDDEGAAPAQESCATPAPAIGGRLIPASALAAFDGEDLQATWTLRVSDNAGQDTGTLQQWCIAATVVGGAAGRDLDGDGFVDEVDNCVLVANDQRDSDGDGLGNGCDPDIALPNDCQVNFSDLGTLKNAFFSTPASANWNPDADFDGDDVVGFTDLGLMKTFFFSAPGVSAIPNDCL